MTTAKRVLSMLLVLFMVLGMLPVTALAAEGAHPFTDIPSDEWYADPVQYVYENDLMNGISPTLFDPDGLTTRAMLVTVLYRMEGSPEASGEGFTDVEESEWYGPAVLWASANNIVQGFPGNVFMPNDPITREQMATVFYRYVAYKGYDVSSRTDLSVYTDGDDVSDWAKDAMSWAVSVGLIQGVGDSLLAYQSDATRAQIATILMRFEQDVEPELPTEPVDPDEPEIPEMPSSFNVTFLLNDGTEGAYMMDVVSANSCVERPADPSRLDYSFTGWYTDAQQVTEYDFSTPVTYDLVLYAGWSSPNADAAEEDDKLYASSSGGGTIYSITGLRMNGSDVEATINVNSSSILIVDFLDEETKEVLTTVAVQTPEYCEMVPVSIPVDYELPQYYVIDAVLLDFSGEEISNHYSCIKYTSAYEAFQSQTVADFPEDRVLNFDDDPTTNFGVLKESVVRLPESEEYNLVTLIRTFSEEDPMEFTETYVFDNPDEQVSSLVVGDVVTGVDIEGNAYLFKIGTIEVLPDGCIIMTPDENSALADFYDVLEVNMDLSLEDAELADVSGSGVQTYAEVIDVADSWSGAISGNLDGNWDTDSADIDITGTLTGTGTVELEMIYDAKLFSEDFFSCSVVSILELELDINVETDLNNDDLVEAELELAKVFIPTPVAGLTVFFAPTLPTEWELAGGVTFEYTSTQRSGFIYDTYNGRQDVDEKERTVSIGMEASATISFGPKIALGVEYLAGVVSAEVSAQAGIRASAETALDLVNVTDGPSKHACTVCIEGNCNWFVSVDAELTFCIIEDVLDATPIDLNLFTFEGDVIFLPALPGEFYVSVVNSSESIFEGKLHFGGGECPNRTWRVTVKAEDENGNTLDKRVTLYKQNNSTISSGAAPHVDYLYDGIYRAAAVFDGHTVSKHFVINENAATVTLTPNSANGKLSGRVYDAAGATVQISMGDIVVASCYSDASGDYIITLPEGEYLVKISKSGYVTFTAYQIVRENDITYMESAMMVYGEKQLMGGLSGYITDAVTGAPIEGVELTLRNAYNNDSEGPVVERLTTDSNGKFEYSGFQLRNIFIGLPIGNYTATATKSGYITSSFNLYVLPGQVVENQNATLTPEANDGDYRIVLTWGSTPSDLDSHYLAETTSGSTEHVYFSNKVTNSANLDVDDTSSYGPETVTITDFSSISEFVYSVYDYSNGGNSANTAMATSGAVVRLYKGTQLLQTYPVPVNGVGDTWHVFKINSSGRITSLNTFCTTGSSANVGMDQLGAQVAAYSMEPVAEVPKN